MLAVNGFYGHVRRNDVRSIVLFAGFLIAIELAAAVVLALPLALHDVDRIPFLNPAAYLARYAIPVALFGAALFAIRFYAHVGAVRAAVGFCPVEHWSEPRLIGIVTEQAMSVGLPVPGVAIIESPALNAFACGRGINSSVVVVTRGLIDDLDDDELRAVIAHEITHILHADVRLVAAATVLVEIVAWIRRHNPLRLVGYRQVMLAMAVPPILVVFVAAWLALRAAMALARFSRAMVAGAREFIADAEAVRMTQNPAALISALRRIQGRSHIAGLDPRAEAMMIDGPSAGHGATHPPLSERIAVLMRLAGPLAHVSPRRHDTRGNEAIPPHEGFGRKRFILPAPVAAADEKTFGLSPVLLGLGVVAVLGVGVLTAARGGSPMALVAYFRGDAMLGLVRDRNAVFRAGPLAEREAAERDIAEHDAAAVTSAAAEGRAVPTHGLHRRAAADPVGTQCFATEAYAVGDRGMYRLRPVDDGLVQAYLDGAPGSDVRLERYLALRLRAARAAAAGPDAALLGYVNSRKTLLQTVHRFYGEPGLRLMLDAYDSDADRAILDALRTRVDAGAPLLAADRRTAAEIALLLTAPERFVPCAAKRA